MSRSFSRVEDALMREAGASRNVAEAWVAVLGLMSALAVAFIPILLAPMFARVAKFRRAYKTVATRSDSPVPEGGEAECRDSTRAAHSRYGRGGKTCSRPGRVASQVDRKRESCRDRRRLGGVDAEVPSMEDTFDSSCPEESSSPVPTLQASVKISSGFPCTCPEGDTSQGSGDALRHHNLSRISSPRARPSPRCSPTAHPPRSQHDTSLRSPRIGGIARPPESSEFGHGSIDHNQRRGTSSGASQRLCNGASVAGLPTRGDAGSVQRHGGRVNGRGAGHLGGHSRWAPGSDVKGLGSSLPAAGSGSRSWK